jgi:pimeloyl-ACP methyl ester carboxylesterase
VALPDGSSPLTGRLPLTSPEMSRRTLAITLATMLLTGASAVVGVPAAGAILFSACASTPGFTCATVPVPLDRTGALPGTISLSVARRLAGAAPSRDAVVALAGGPGQAAVPLAEFIAQAISPALSTRDLLVFDQRGTGTSDPLSCPALTSATTPERSSSVSALVERCARELGPPRGVYTTQESVADIEALRQAAGYEKLVLYGTSYGTKVALKYAERYPQNVEALVLDSTETPEGPEAFHVSTFKAMTPVLRELCSRGACAGVTKNPVTDVAHLVTRLSKGPLTGHAYDEHGKPVKLSVTRSDLYGLLLAGDLDPALRAEMPAAVHSALGHDPGPLLHLEALGGVAPAGEESSEVDLALFVDTSCEETRFPWQRTAPEATRAVEVEGALNAMPTSDFYPFDPEAGLLDQTIPLCLTWPDASPAPPGEAALPDVPTLIFSGGQDLRTPTENARNVAKLIPDAQVLTVPYAGHSVVGSDLTGCAQAALVTFFAGAPVKPCHASVNHFPPAPLAPGSLAAVNPTPGVKGAAGRTLTATVDTVGDLRRTIIVLAINLGQVPVGARFGGLRGGTVKVNKTGVVLSHLSYVPGVQLSGVIPTELLLKDKGSAANLTIAGPAAANGHMRISQGEHIAGVLAGRGFAVTVPAKALGARAARAGREPEWPAASLSFPLPGLARIR